MQDLIVVTPLQIEGALLCRIPACAEHATVHVDSYMRCPAEESWWDPHNSGPLCLSHLAKLKGQVEDCEIRQVPAKDLSLAIPADLALSCCD